MFTKLSQKSIYQDSWLEFFQDQIQLADGSVGTYAWVKRKNGVAIVVITPDRRVLLHKEYRYVIQDFSWEIPGGGIDVGETATQAAVRELSEESGMVIAEDKLHKLGTFFPLNSFNTESITLFMTLTVPVEVHIRGTEASESITIPRFVGFDEALAMIDNGTISDAFTAHALQMAIRNFDKLS